MLPILGVLSPFLFPLPSASLVPPPAALSRRFSVFPLRSRLAFLPRSAYHFLPPRRSFSYSFTPFPSVPFRSRSFHLARFPSTSTPATSLENLFRLYANLCTRSCFDLTGHAKDRTKSKACLCCMLRTTDVFHRAAQVKGILSCLAKIY